jgi:hypothetical protein
MLHISSKSKFEEPKQKYQKNKKIRKITILNKNLKPMCYALIPYTKEPK